MADIENETLALAALFQACMQIQRVAKTGYIDAQATAPVIRALIITNPKTCDDIYNKGSLLMGYRQILSSFGTPTNQRTEEAIEITALAFKLITLENNIENSSVHFEKLSSDIDMARGRILFLKDNYENASADEIVDKDIIKEFASIYQSIISPNFPKLIIYGEESYLRVEENQTMIRALLLAAIRAIVLWRQVGGRRRYLIFRRKAIIECARSVASNNFK